jgi:hypothetical protein
MFTCEHFCVRFNGDIGLIPNGAGIKNRTLKIVRHFGKKQYAALPLAGRWLEQAGFTVDMPVRVIVRNRCLVIVPLEECQRSR